MTFRKFTQIDNCETRKHADIAWCSELQEFRVKFYKQGVHQVGADYHTDDRQDALATAQLETGYAFGACLG